MFRYNEVAQLLEPPRSRPADDDMWDLREWLPPGFDPARFDAGTADQQVAAALLPEEELAADLPDTAALRELAARLDPPGLRSLRALVAAAEITTATEVDLAAALRPFLVLLERAGGDGEELTGAGRLRPARVKELLTTLGWDAPWLGEGNREDYCPPIRHLRAAAHSIGLVRRHRGRLVLTPAGRRVASDPEALWQHVATRLPVGRHEWQRSAGVLALLSMAGGGRDTFDAFAPGILADARWGVDGLPPNQWQAFEWARPTWEVTWALAEEPGSLRRVMPSHIRALARTALTTDP